MTTKILRDFESVIENGSRDEFLLRQIELDRLPSHIAIIMDGNGRWAARRNQPRIAGHRAGSAAVRTTVETSARLGVAYLTLYAFSTENWKRPRSEVRYLMTETINLVERLREEFHQRDVRMRWIGRRDWRVPKRIGRLIDETVELTKSNGGMTLTIAYNYGGRAEIVDAVRKIVDERPSKVDERTVARALYDPELPDVDLFIRTGGEQRLSNYLLWQSSYAELVFLDVLWPDFAAEHLAGAIDEFHRRQRRFGRV